jgi:hypothetical protein
MKPQYNPVHKRAERNVFCPYYANCLDYAIEEAWEYWGCCDCSQRFNQAGRPEFRFTVSDETEYFDLPVEIGKGCA